MAPSNSPKPPVQLGFVSRIGVNVRIYYCPCLACPHPLILMLCLEETPQTDTRLQKLRPSVNLPRPPLGFQEKVH